jgi:hypothetical protein
VLLIIIIFVLYRFADQDALTSPAARIVVGRVPQGGTGAFELYQPLVAKAK